MDYIVGSVAALISGNVTPNRQRPFKKASTPIKHQPSPNVTPKGELVEDRSIFLSPTLQKKKAIVKKSPKRIFGNPNLDMINEEDDNSEAKSPKANKVKKHLKKDLIEDVNVHNAQSSKNKELKLKASPLKKEKNENKSEIENLQFQIKTSSKKKKGKIECTTENETNTKTELKKSEEIAENNSERNLEPCYASDKNAPNVNVKKHNIKILNTVNDKLPVCQKSKIDLKVTKTLSKNLKKKKNKQRMKSILTLEKIGNGDKSGLAEDNMEEGNLQSHEKKTKHHRSILKQHNKDLNEEETVIATSSLDIVKDDDDVKGKKKKKSKVFVNPNAITHKDTDSEHESDDDIKSENEESNKEVLDTGPLVDSSDDDKNMEKPNKQEETVHKNKDVNTIEDVKRTLFVGNVPFSSKCKKEIKRIFGKYGQIETVRIRTVPVKDGHFTPKLAVIKGELHPDRSTVNVYVKFHDAASVEKALAENNTVLNDHHLRVTRSDCTGAEHDPKCSIFVGNLPFALEDETLHKTFEKCGTIESVRIIRDKKTNAGKGFGYVNFRSKDAVELALALSEEDLTIKNRILRVKRCTQMTHKQKLQQNSHKILGQNNQVERKFEGNNRGRGNYRGGRNFQGNNQGEKSLQRNNQGENSFQGNNQGGRNIQSRHQYGRNSGERNIDRGNQQNRITDGAFRRLNNKRKNQDFGSDGPSNKRQRNINQPNKEKKMQKNFVGITAETKKKNKFDKGQKKKKALSEILTKQ